METSLHFDFPFRIRQAMQVAEAVAEDWTNEVYVKYWQEREQRSCDSRLRRPVLLSFRDKKGTLTTTFNYEGGLVVKVHLMDGNSLLPRWDKAISEDWMVTHVTLRFYKPGTNALTSTKVEEIWEADKLFEIKGGPRGWNRSPNIFDRMTIETAFVVVDGFRSNYIDELRIGEEEPIGVLHRISYKVHLRGDRERAQSEAQRLLDALPPR